MTGQEGFTKSCIFEFNEIYERDIDMLIAEEIVSNYDFFNLFLNKIGKKCEKVFKVEISKTHQKYGESDVTVIYNFEGVKHALLIEDKIDAIAMDNQYGRYVKRGEIGIQNKEYTCFDVFIVAPEVYLISNGEAQKYPNHMSYENLIAYFEKKNDIKSSFQESKLRRAIIKKETGYNMIADDAVTSYRNQYIDYCIEFYPGIVLRSKKDIKPKAAVWLFFKTVMKELYICHKSDRGYVDLTFSNVGDHLIELGELLEKMIPDLDLNKYNIVKVGKAGALRLYVPLLDFSIDFKEVNRKDIEDCFQAILHMTQLVKKFNDTRVRLFLRECLDN